RACPGSGGGCRLRCPRRSTTLRRESGRASRARQAFGSSTAGPWVSCILRLRENVARTSARWSSHRPTTPPRQIGRNAKTMKIPGSTTVITGGASGLGRATAERLVGSGGRVALLDLPTSTGIEAAKAMGPEALFTAADVTSAEDVTAALDAAMKR